MSGACRSLSVEVGGVLFFCCFLRPLHDSLATENDCSGNDGAGKLSQVVHKKTSVPVVSWWQLSFLSHFIGKCQCKHAVLFEIKSREEN